MSLKTNKKIWLADKLSPKCEEALINAGFQVSNRPGLSEEEKLVEITSADGVILRSSTTIAGPLLEAAQNLKITVRAGIGVDNIDLAACKEKGVVVENTPFGNANAAAEQAVALMFATARFIPQAHAKMMDGVWAKKDFMGMELKGKQLGLIGGGNIGCLVAEKARGLGMDVAIYDPHCSSERLERLGVNISDLNGIFAHSDFVSLHVPLNEGTRNIVNAERLEQMKSTAILINASRGGTVDEDALVEALKSGSIAAAALDVYAEEPMKGPHKYIGLDNVVLTPHLGASTHDAQVQVAVDAAEQVIAFFVNDEVRNQVN